MPTDETSRPLNYAHRGSSAKPPNPLAATLLCLPGFTCWCLLALPYASSYVRLWPGPRFGIDLTIISILSLWAIAVLFAIVSIGMYEPVRPKPWYVWLNLIINGTGLLFTVAIFVLILWPR